MTDSLGSRVALVCSLVAVGLVVAGLGTALGAGDPAMETTAGSFVVSDANVTYVSGDRERIVVDDLTGVESVTIERTATRFSVRTEHALNATERERARRIARGNETVRRILDGTEGATLVVEPIRKIPADAATDLDVSTVDDANVSVEGSNETVVVRAEEQTDGGRSDVAVVRRETEYVDDEAIVEIRGPADTVRYTVHVDLASGTVEDVRAER